MKKTISTIILVAFFALPPQGILAARAPIPVRKASPYLGAMATDGKGRVFFEEGRNEHFYPASLVKLMVLLVIQEKLDAGKIGLADRVTVTAEAAGMGGSQVYLAENEVFTVEELLYALIIQSANDAAVALAEHLAGSTKSFVELMNEKALELEMSQTEFHSVHGLPPGRGQKPDISTPEDITRLCLELLRHPSILSYTSIGYRPFRDGTFEMRSHNPLLEEVEGCDGLKTGYFRAGGYSIAATAEREGERRIVVVAGAEKKEERNAAARDLLNRAFFISPDPEIDPLETVEGGPPAPIRTIPTRKTEPGDEKTKEDAPEYPDGGRGPTSLLIYLAVFIAQAGFFFWLGRRSRRNTSSRFPPTILRQ